MYSLKLFYRTIDSSCNFFPSCYVKQTKTRGELSFAKQHSPHTRHGTHDTAATFKKN